MFCRTVTWTVALEVREWSKVGTFETHLGDKMGMTGEKMTAAYVGGYTHLVVRQKAMPCEALVLGGSV